MIQDSTHTHTCPNAINLPITVRIRLVGSYLRRTRQLIHNNILRTQSIEKCKCNRGTSKLYNISADFRVLSTIIVAGIMLGTVLRGINSHCRVTVTCGYNNNGFSVYGGVRLNHNGPESFGGTRGVCGHLWPWPIYTVRERPSKSSVKSPSYATPQDSDDDDCSGIITTRISIIVIMMMIGRCPTTTFCWNARRSRRIVILVTYDLTSFHDQFVISVISIYALKSGFLRIIT